MGRAIAAGAVLVWLVALAAAAASPHPKEGATVVSPQPEEGVAAEENRAAAEDQPLVLPRTHLLGTHAHGTHSHGTHSHGTHALDDRLDLLEYKLLTLAARCPETFCAPAEKRPRACRPLRGCQRSPSPLPADQAPHQEPAALACACSCLQLQQQGGSPESGVYWFTGMKVPVMCDFDYDDGGWTLLLTAVSKNDWDPYSVLARDELSPTLTDNYSILKHADDIRDLGTGDRFAYRIETQADTLGRRHWGGIWFAPQDYSFVDEMGTQTDVALMRRFDDWLYANDGVRRRMPWINTGGYYEMRPVLTTAGQNEDNWWGTMVTHPRDGSYQHSPWHNPANSGHSGKVLYWMRENAVL